MFIKHLNLLEDNITAAGAVYRELYTENYIKIAKKNAPDGRWEAGDSLKILSRSAATFSTIGSFILRTFIFRLFFDTFQYFRIFRTFHI